MLRFSTFLAEEKNKHLEHLEDSILNLGMAGAKQAVDYLGALGEMLSGSTNGRVNVTVKWDGSPALIAGLDPTDGAFFVAKKSVFNKNPKVYKTKADIDADTSGDLNRKLKVALEELPKLGITGVVQGDFLYTKEDLQEIKIDGESYITFHPNTIVYAVPKNSNIGRAILASRIGVVWHTTYRGQSFETMSANFGEEIASGLKKVKSVWSVDSVYKDVSGTATFTQAETEEFNRRFVELQKTIQLIKRETLEGIRSNPDLLTRVKMFINTKVREGQQIGNTHKFVDDMALWIHNHYQKDIDSKKSEVGRVAAVTKRKVAMQYFSDMPKGQIVALFDVYNAIIDLKLMIIQKLDLGKQIGTFLRTADGLKVTEQEGFVAIDHMGKNAVKLVDRLRFSYANFSPNIIKGFEKRN